MAADRALRVAGIAGSLRRGSFNRGLLRAAVESVPDGMTIEPLEIAISRSTTPTSTSRAGPRPCAR
jgi:NAD(P)H-dependent FMN reductase